MNRPYAKGRGSQINPRNRFEHVLREADLEHLEFCDDEQGGPATEYFADKTKTIVAENDSPDVPFRYSLNPYRGCAHGCAYCYARQTHEYLGFNAGLDFESKILVKQEAPDLFRNWLARDEWRPQLIAFSGVTDCYQPCERQFRLTRGCLEVALAARQPIGIVTKNALVTRDLHILQQMAERKLISVSLSLTTLDADLARQMEPRTSTPAARLRAIKQLSSAGIPVNAMVAPMIPGLNDHEMPAMLQAAADAGAHTASYILLRLPFSVREVFLEWLQRTQPQRAPKVLSRIQSTRDGKLSEYEYGKRMHGSGKIAEQIAQNFRVFTSKAGLNDKQPMLDFSQFHPPKPTTGQLRLF